MSTPPPEQQQQDVEPIDPRLLRRLFIALLLIIALGVVSAIFLPRANVSIPWYVFAIAFVAIVAAALAPLFERDIVGEDEPADTPRNPPQ